MPGIRVFLQNPPPVRIGSRAAKSQYQYTLQSTDIASLYDNASASSRHKLKTVPVLDNVTSDLQIKNPEVRVDIDRDRAAALGVTAEADPGGALLRLRLAPGVHHLHPQQPVRGHHGAGAALPDRPHCAAAA